MKTKPIVILAFVSFLLIVVNGCRTTKYDKFPLQTDTEIVLLKDIEAINVKVYLTKIEDISINVGHKSLQNIYQKILVSKSWNEEFKQKVRTEYDLFNTVCDSAKINNTGLSLLEENTLFPILKSRLGESIDDFLYKGNCLITVDSVPIDKIIYRRIDYSEYSCQIQYLYKDKVFWSYSMEI